MIRTLAALALALAALAPAAAQQTDGPLDHGGDRFRAAGTVVVDTPGLKDVFAAGERVEIAAPIAGSAHLAGRRVETTAAIGGDLYALGADLRIDGPIAGAATLVGYDLVLLGPVEGNLRAAGKRVTLRGPVAGAASVAGGEVTIAGAIAGDAVISARSLAFGPQARIGGTLTLYSEAGDSPQVPVSVIPPDRIDHRVLENRPPMVERMAGPGWRALALGFGIGALILTALATIAASLAPRDMARLGAIVGEGPLRAFGFGFLAQSALIGGAVLLAFSLVGIVLAPFLILAAILFGAAGYVVSVYLLGAWIITRLGALAPDSVAEYAAAALAGALIATFLGLVPFLGWFVFFAFGLTGAGALTIARLRRRYGV